MRDPSEIHPRSRPGKQGKSIKAFVEVDGNVHIVHVAMAAIESVAELRGALTAACIETGAVSGASELADLNFELDAALQIHYLDDQNVARLVQDDTPIGLLKCAKALCGHGASRRGFHTQPTY